MLSWGNFFQNLSLGVFLVPFYVQKKHKKFEKSRSTFSWVETGLKFWPYFHGKTGPKQPKKTRFLESVLRLGRSKCHFLALKKVASWQHALMCTPQCIMGISGNFVFFLYTDLNPPALGCIIVFVLTLWFGGEWNTQTVVGLDILVHLWMMQRALVWTTKLLG